MGAIEAVQHVLLREREQGTAILLISEELEEVMSLSDRIVGIYEGQNMGELTRRRSDPDRDRPDDGGNTARRRHE